MGSGNFNILQRQERAGCHGDARFFFPCFFFSLPFPLFGVEQEESGRLLGGFISSKIGHGSGKGEKYCCGEQHELGPNIQHVLSGKGCKSGLGKYQGSTKVAHLPRLILGGDLWKTPKGFNATADDQGIIKRGEEEGRHFKASWQQGTALGWLWLSGAGHHLQCQPVALSAGHFCTNLAGFWSSLAGDVLLGCTDVSLADRRYAAAWRVAGPC